MISRCLVRCLVELVMSFNAFQVRMPSQFKGSSTLVNRARFSDGWSLLHVRLNGRTMWILSWRMSINVWIWLCESSQILATLMCIQPLMCLLLTLHYATLRWIRKMRLRSLMLNQARMSLAFVLMIVYIVGLMMSVRPPRRFLWPRTIQVS
jgi:hypothetical protein